ncbi:MAG: peptide chain release factor aRF-1 [Candidatus Micrarchaeota archaeon]|nr:peptide chain release factor aRF-1 [Candidatus Micrarchaeota archaeon]
MADNEYAIRRELKKLASIRGSGTELISVYIPPDFSIAEEMGKLKEEHGQAGNIKSKSTRQNVQGALDKIIQFLRLYKKVPSNGLAIFAGNVSNIQSNPQIELFKIEPLSPIKSNIYRCDSEFMLEPLQAMMEANDLYIVLLMDGKEANTGILKGTRFDSDKNVRNFAPSKTSKGGQSAARYERVIEAEVTDYYNRIGDAVNDLYLKHAKKSSGLIVGGPGPNKESFLKSGKLNYQIKVLGIFDTGYTDEHTGIKELMDKAKDLLSQQAMIKERAVMEKFMAEIGRNGLAVFGYEKVKAALDSGNVSRLLIGEDLELTKVKYKCTNCKQELEEIEEGNFRRSKHDCGGNLEVVSQGDVIEELIEQAEKGGVEMVFMASDSAQGKQLMLGFKGIGAMLRYRR